MPKVVLAHSGRLDPSICIHWLRHRRGLRVIAFAANLGQGEHLEPMGETALETGAEAAHIEDLRETFVKDYILPALKANARFESGCFLSAALSRHLIAAELVNIALEEGCEYVAHGCSAKGNDQVRIEASIAALAPHLKVIAPLREWGMKSREDEIEYAERNRIPVTITKESPYSIDRNLWGVRIECGDLEDPWREPPADTYIITKSPSDAPDSPTEVEIGFEEGTPVSLDGQESEPIKIIERLNEVGGENGVGRFDVVENRIVGIKSREIYETPAAAILYQAHGALEELTLGEALSHYKDIISKKYAEVVHGGLWFSDLRVALDAFVESTQKYVTGTVRLRLYKGNCTTIGRRSPFSLYDRKLSTYGRDDAFDHKAAGDFLKIMSLPLRAEAQQKRAESDREGFGPC